MSDSTMDDIKSGKGLEPLQSSTSSGSEQEGVTIEQRTSCGITYETFSKNDYVEHNKK